MRFTVVTHIALVVVLAIAPSWARPALSDPQSRDIYNRTEPLYPDPTQIHDRAAQPHSAIKITCFVPSTALNGISKFFKQQTNQFENVNMGKNTGRNIKTFVERIAAEKLKVAAGTVNMDSKLNVYKDKKGKRVAFIVQILDSPTKVCGPKNLCVGVVSDGVLVKKKGGNGIIWSTNGNVNDLQLVKQL
ncbi:hypothetical protein GYMLUDRAFT_261358 [Collybiopsis luxurians FD-317 M1]|uniref:Uncharacterized protein n=1 Tax=Collybiopsis luxurians FD-317 M1 TaxID=944289 RepID=A0A0D0CCV6_9AGAR|nr:hypothetical protein GYMLUDRAFT_261358 [Collybiopsis luxurians FD-317 M1]